MNIMPIYSLYSYIMYSFLSYYEPESKQISRFCLGLGEYIFVPHDALAQLATPNLSNQDSRVAGFRV